MLGKVGFEDLKVQCIIGVDPHERLQKQDLYIDVQVDAEFGVCSASDRLHDAEVNYFTLAETCIQVVGETQYHLLETLACHLMSHLFEKFAIDWIYLKIKKPRALPYAHHAFVEIERFRDEA